MRKINLKPELAYVFSNKNKISLLSVEWISIFYQFYVEKRIRQYTQNSIIDRSVDLIVF